MFKTNDYHIKSINYEQLTKIHNIKIHILSLDFPNINNTIDNCVGYNINKRTIQIIMDNQIIVCR